MERLVNKVFISYARRDSAKVGLLVNALRNVDITGWLDAADIASGESVASVVRAALKDSGAVVVLVSPDALESQWVQFELGAAEALRKPIIPVLISGGDVEKNLPDILRTRQWIDARNKPERQVVEEIEQALTAQNR